MTRRAALLLSLLFITSAARAAWFPVFEPSYVQVRPGQSFSVPVHASWLSGISFFPFTTMTFAAEDPAVATVTGTLLSSAAGLVQVTGLQPGV